MFVLIAVFSGRIIRPVSESYEKQKRFITDDGFIDLTEPVREHVLMAIPIDPISPAFQDDEKAQANLEKLIGEDSADWLKINWSDKKKGPD